MESMQSDPRCPLNPTFQGPISEKQSGLLLHTEKLCFKSTRNVNKLLFAQIGLMEYSLSIAIIYYDMLLCL